MVTFTGAPVGGFVGGQVVAALLRHYDWPVIFVLGGVFPLILLPIMALWLPESPRFLPARANLGSRDHKLLARLGITLGGVESTHYTVADTWRFWIIHLWVEGFVELFVTVIVAIIFYQLGLVERATALRVIYLDVILIFGGGLIGTGHHWYFTGQTELNMALSATFSALEVVPLTLLTLDAADFVTVTRGEAGEPFRHKWTFYFLMAVGFWNFTGAGVFGFLINMPIVSSFEAGTNLTPNHGHAAMMGVFGMLGIALTVFVLRETIHVRSGLGLKSTCAAAFGVSTLVSQ
jgi:nitric oxide reductase large subunit